VPAAIAIAFALVMVRPSTALIVGNVPGTVANTSINPASLSGWTHGDPGWNNVAIGGNYVYLGDGWVLSARHVGYSHISGIQFQTPTGPQTFYRIPGTYYQDYGYLHTNGDFYYAVSNPSSIQTESGLTHSLTQFTDLQLFRISGDPGLPSLTVSSQPATTSNFTRANAPSVVMVGGSGGRSPTQTQWNVSQHSQEDWTWTQTAGPGTHQGYVSDGFLFKRWGTNRLTDIRPNSNEPVDTGATDYSGIFEAVISDTTAVLALPTSDGITRDIIANMTVYDQLGQPGAPAYNSTNTNLEAQAIQGDSGSSVFFKRGNQWELGGIVNATFTYTDQPGHWAVYGNTSMISDLSYYNKNYLAGDKAQGRFSIKDIIEGHPDYSMMGDVNLDGIVSGNGSGAASVDDVAAFIAGWNYNNGTGRGSITSWQNGDLNHDGRTDVSDFLKLRGALNSKVTSATLASLLGISEVPEPSTGLLVLLGVSMLGLSARRRRAG
jgi:hypothetical protein